MSEPITEAELDVIKARAAEVFTGPRMAADREELLRAFGENVPHLTQEIRRLRAQLETEILHRDSLDETLNNVVADHKKDLTKLAAIRKAAEPLAKIAKVLRTYAPGYTISYDPDNFICVETYEALADALKELPQPPP